MVVLFAQAFAHEPKAPELDEFYYLTMARDYDLHGTITNGPFKGGAFSRDEHPEITGDADAKWVKPGRFFTPGYPAVIYIAGLLDPRTSAAVSCHVANWGLPDAPKCPNSFGTLIAFNVILWSIAMVAVYQIARHFVESEAAAWFAMLIAMFCGETGTYYARTYLSENLIVPSFCLFLLFALRAVDRKAPLNFFMAGAFLGLSSLARPGYVYLFYTLVAVMSVMAMFPRRAAVVKFSSTLFFTAGALAVLSPWLIRNYLTFGDFRVSADYAELILIQRAAYNQMSWSEWLVSFLYWIPDFGDDVARKYLPRELWEKLGWSDVSYYISGSSGAFKQAILAANPTDNTVLPYVLKTYIWGDPIKHTAVTFALALRGAGVGRYIAILAWLLFVPAFQALKARGKERLFVILVALPVFMVGLHAFVSVSITRYNISMIAVYATVIAVAAEVWFYRWRAKGPGK